MASSLEALPPLLPLRDFITQHMDWVGWEAVIDRSGITIERPRRSVHPRFPEIIYPIDYGYVNGTVGSDGDEVDVFVGTANTGLIAAMITDDFRRGDREIKLLYRCGPEEVYLVNGFINFNSTLMQGLLLMRRPLHELW